MDLFQLTGDVRYKNYIHILLKDLCRYRIEHLNNSCSVKGCALVVSVWYEFRQCSRSALVARRSFPPVNNARGALPGSHERRTGQDMHSTASRRDYSHSSLRRVEFAALTASRSVTD